MITHPKDKLPPGGGDIPYSRLYEEVPPKRYMPLLGYTKG